MQNGCPGLGEGIEAAQDLGFAETSGQIGISISERAYVLATAYHETGNFRWLRELWGPTPAQTRYEGRADLGNTVAGDGRRFMGRGYVQITGRRNYTDWGKRLGLDLLNRPDLAEEPDIAAQILVEGMRLGTFTGKSLADYTNSNGVVHYQSARRIVNGTDRAELIAGYARAYEAAIRAAEPVRAGWLAALIQSLGNLFRSKR
ncbi:glycoside hydrolase family 19 protein [Pseudogemmobacter faecipullorum]|uniref:Glycoside hydrolase family 19 catalytic domain-containing protein n=1 Tax=Pseudogemmobacter faecipullorum TaxID=2755041 RepID=A0ABS8CSF5_9RHOB|nr:glycoside hydrolase family 19 protein [Pseudogemmobacter faecipullorum]MCB5412336.1 hypothetical protein [Pseudogemmobacter faecipullorum]